MINERNGIELSKIPILEDNQVYVYILLNSAGKVKVGKTTNINQRIQNLSGSNGAGDEIIKCYCSSATYLVNTLEQVMHARMQKYRIPKTEWFYCEDSPTGKALYSSAVKLLDRIMCSDDYKKCNRVRKEFVEKKEKNR